MPRIIVQKTILLAVLSSILAPIFVSEDFSGRVVGISDGDTISVMHDGKPRKSG